MTVRQLIAQLRKLPPSAEVAVRDRSGYRTDDIEIFIDRRANTIELSEQRKDWIK